MPEEALETQDVQEIKEKLEESRGERDGRERTGEGERNANAWTVWLSLSTAVIAVLAAIASLEAGANANDAILRKDDAILHQSRAGDAWSHYQAAGIKSVVYATQAAALAPPEVAARWQVEADRERDMQKDIKTEADAEEARVEEMDEKAAHKLHVHHQFAKSVTVFQVSIALAAIAALTRRKPMWWVSLAVGACGLAFFAIGVSLN
jgi:Domain of unknown function (DUF4337)